MSRALISIISVICFFSYMTFCCSDHESLASDSLPNQSHQLYLNSASDHESHPHHLNSVDCHSSSKIADVQFKSNSDINFTTGFFKASNQCFLRGLSNDLALHSRTLLICNSPPAKFKDSIPIYLKIAVLRI